MFFFLLLCHLGCLYYDQMNLLHFVSHLIAVNDSGGCQDGCYTTCKMEEECINLTSVLKHM